MSTLNVENLAVGYGRTEAVRGIDLAVGDGQVAALIGANGAGKTTTLRALSGLLRPRAGRVLLDGRDITGLAPHRISARGMVQVPEGRQVFAHLTVAENLTLGGWSVPRTVAARQRERILARFPRLGERLTQPAGGLSGGEQQMLAMGRALMAAPRLLLLDEPSMGLAPLVVEEIFALIAELKADGVTILLVEQNASAALEVADTAYVLEVGRITLSGPAWKVATDPAVVAAYLGG
jgi:branched-chain amino acid transport system ATP-binding protein